MTQGVDLVKSWWWESPDRAHLEEHGRPYQIERSVRYHREMAVWGDSQTG